MERFRCWSFVAALVVTPLLGATPAWRSLECDSGLSLIYPIASQSTSDNPLVNASQPLFVKITPDATRAVVGSSNANGPNLFSLDVTTTPISIAASSALANIPGALAMTPDGASVYVVDAGGSVDVVKTADTSTVTVIPSSAFEGYSPFCIALSPTKPEGYVTTKSTKVYIFRTNENGVIGSLDLPSGAQSSSVVAAPNGSEIYVGDAASNAIYYISLGDTSPHLVGGLPSATCTNGVVVSSDGLAAYAIQTVKNGSLNLVKIDTASHSVTNQYAIPPQFTSAAIFLAQIPGGKGKESLCVIDQGTELFPAKSMAIINTTSGTPSILQIYSEAGAHGEVVISSDRSPNATITFAVWPNTLG